MSHSSPSYYTTADQAARYVQSRAQSAGAISRHLHRTHDGYTLTHAGHQVRIGPVAFWIVVGTLVIMAVWSIATGSYFAFRDNVLTRLIGRQAEMQFAYEDRIAELRAKVDRIMSSPVTRPRAVREKTQCTTAAASHVGATQLGAYQRSVDDRYSQTRAHRAVDSNPYRETGTAVANQ